MSRDEAAFQRILKELENPNSSLDRYSRAELMARMRNLNVSPHGFGGNTSMNKKWQLHEEAATQLVDKFGQKAPTDFLGASLRSEVNTKKRTNTNNPNNSYFLTEDPFASGADALAFLDRAISGTDPVFKFRKGIEQMYKTIVDQPGSKQTKGMDQMYASNNMRGFLG